MPMPTSGKSYAAGNGIERTRRHGRGNTPRPNHQSPVSSAFDLQLLGIGVGVARLFKRQKKSPEQVAAAAGISAQYLRDFLSDQRALSFTELLRVAAAAGVSIEQLLEAGQASIPYRNLGPALEYVFADDPSELNRRIAGANLTPDEVHRAFHETALSTEFVLKVTRALRVDTDVLHTALRRVGRRTPKAPQSSTAAKIQAHADVTQRDKYSTPAESSTGPRIRRARTAASS
jgi:transcriptional regulator with XRE-family HTH domain